MPPTPPRRHAQVTALWVAAMLVATGAAIVALGSTSGPRADIDVPDRAVAVDDPVPAEAAPSDPEPSDSAPSDPPPSTTGRAPGPAAAPTPAPSEPVDPWSLAGTAPRGDQAEPDTQVAPIGEGDLTLRSPPRSLRIPRIGVEDGLIDLGLDAEGVLEAPDRGPDIGWYADGIEPGQPGPAIAAGHVAFGRSDAVFARLPELEPDDVVEVEREDGQTLTFTVDRVTQHPKVAFPTEEVYGPTGVPTLRLITCGGVIDPATGRFEDNIIVHAQLTSVS